MNRSSEGDKYYIIENDVHSVDEEKIIDLDDEESLDLDDELLNCNWKMKYSTLEIEVNNTQ